MGPLESAPEATSAFRFMVVSMAQAIAILTLNYALRLETRYPGHRVSLIGWAVEAQAIVIHQGYYWVWWILLANNPNGLPWWKQYREITSAATVVMACGWLMVASPYLAKLFGRWWLVGGVGMAASLWLIGWGIAKWL